MKVLCKLQSTTQMRGVIILMGLSNVSQHSPDCRLRHHVKHSGGEVKSAVTQTVLVVLENKLKILEQRL